MSKSSFSYKWAHGQLPWNKPIKKPTRRRVIKKRSNKSLNNLSGNVKQGFQGFADLIEELQEYMYLADNSKEVLILGAQAFLKDLDQLPKPISSIKKSGYTHLIDSFTYDETEDEVIVGWGKYYGRMVENGTENMDAQPHLYPLWDKNKNKYYQLMINSFKL